jgi:hypothetical protein
MTARIRSILVAVAMAATSGSASAANDVVPPFGGTTPAFPAAEAPKVCTKLVTVPCAGATAGKPKAVAKTHKKKAAKKKVAAVAPPAPVVPAALELPPPPAPPAATEADPGGGGAVSVADLNAVLAETRSADLDFWKLQSRTARRIYGTSEVSLFGQEPPPEVVAKDFGLLVERRFGL